MRKRNWQDKKVRMLALVPERERFPSTGFKLTTNLLLITGQHSWLFGTTSTSACLTVIHRVFPGPYQLKVASIPEPGRES